MSVPEHPAVRAWREVLASKRSAHIDVWRAGDDLAAALEAAETALRRIRDSAVSRRTIGDEWADWVMRIAREALERR